MWCERGCPLHGFDYDVGVPDPPVDDSGEDATLARRVVCGGDRAAEAELCRRLLPRVRAYAFRHQRDHVAVADLAQQVMVIVIEALRAGRVDEPERLAAFVMGTCRNTLSDLRKGQRRRAALLERFGPELVADVAQPPHVLDRARLERCLAALAERERGIIGLTYFADRDGDEIARELSMSEVNVRVTRHRALRHLHECITGGVA